MTMRLVCDHCQGVINDAEFREIRRGVMTRDPNDPLSGTARATEEVTHYHTVCYEGRVRMADRAPMSALPEPAELPDDHPLKAMERRTTEQRDEQIRTQTNVGAQERRGQLEAKNVEELQELASEHDIKGRSKMDKKDLVDALTDKGL